MPKIIPYRLTFHGGLHIGVHGVNLEEAGVTIPSDTLFAALLDACQRKTGAIEAFVRPFIQTPPDPPFLLTSAFPFVGEVLFFPMPLDLTLIFKPETLARRAKQLKRIRFFSQKLFQKALAGDFLDEDLFPADENENPQTGAALNGGTLWLSLEEHALLPKAFQRSADKRFALIKLPTWSVGRLPRVTVSRISSAANLFHAGRIVFAEGVGLWFGVSWLKPEASVQTTGGSLTYQAAYLQALSVLKDDGLGGERSTGYGAFSWKELAPLVLGGDLKPGQMALLLSRYHPRKDELPAALKNDRAAYGLAAVGGWLRSPEGPAQRRKRVYMVTEGSLVKISQQPAGDLCNVVPTYENVQGDLPHPVYRSGLALAVPWSARQGRS